MDPNETLKELRALAKDIETSEQVGMINNTAWQELATELADKVANLDEWMCNGGFTPNDWNVER